MADSELVVVTGGARSGKSAHAQGLAEQSVGPLLYIATAEINNDEELAERIRRQRAGRSRRFATMEVPIEVTGALASLRGIGAAVLDCASFWVANMLARGMTEGEIIGRTETFLEVVRAREHRTVIVTSEIGWTSDPPDAFRQLRNLQGTLNQRLVQAADAVILMVSGLPVRIKTRQGVRLFATG